MKSFIAILMAALMVLSFVSVASAADTIEIRSPVFDAGASANLSDIDVSYTDYTTFAAFYYDIDDGIGSENISFVKEAGNTITEGNLIYTANMQEVSYEYEGFTAKYFKMGFLAQEFIPVGETGTDPDPQLLSKLILDDDEKYTMRVGQTLDLGEGFALTPKQIDVEGDKVWLELTKDGKFLDDDVYDATPGTDTNPDNKSWDYEADLAGEDDVVVLRVHVNEVFQGQVDSLAIIEGIWLMSDEVLEIEDDDEFGKMEVVTTTGNDITLISTEDITLDAGDEIEITDTISIMVADDDNDYLRFYFFEEITEPGTYNVRGSVAAPMGTQETFVWTAENFSGLIYDLDDDNQYETLSITVEADNTTILEEGGVLYTTQMKEVAYEYAGFDTNYYKMGFFAQEYIPVGETGTIPDPQLLSKLILDDDEKYTMRVGQTLDLGEGFALTPKQIDVEGDKVWLELTKDGKFLDDDVYDATPGTDTNPDNKSWDYEADLAGEDDVVVLRVHVNEVFQGQVDSLAIIEGIWLMSDEVMEIEDDDEFGELEVIGSTGDADLTLYNTDEINLDADDEIGLSNGMKLQVNDYSNDMDVRFYPFVELTIEGEDGEAPVDEDGEAPVDETPEEEAPEDAVNVTPEEEAPEDAVNVTPEEEAPEEDEEETPGFEAVFAIAGLLAVAYFVRRN
jgi:S-layer protein (TIGR01567 family)